MTIETANAILLAFNFGLIGFNVHRMWSIRQLMLDNEALHAQIVKLAKQLGLHSA